MELVTEPVIHDAETAGKFARELQLLLRTLGISEAEMSKGEMRVEANISISATDELGTKVEVKNLNSFRSVEGAIAFEIARQTEILNTGGVVQQETRGWDEVKLRTFTQRTKETAKDYRYFPDPDIPKINVPEHSYFSQARLSEILPELPNNKRLNYKNIGLPSSQIELIIGTTTLDVVFSQLYKTYNDTNNELLKLSANYLTSDVLSELGIDSSRAINVGNFAELMLMIVDGKINSRVAKDLLKEILFDTVSPSTLAQERGLLQSSDPSALLSTVAQILAENPTVVAEYYAGKEASVQFLIGQGMKMTRGSANPGVLSEVIKAELEKARK